jgi:hypothetical protein
MCTSRCHHFMEWGDLKSWANCPLAILDHSEFLGKSGEMAYQLELPDNLSDVHNLFHVSQLKKCLRVPDEQLPMEELSVQGDLTYTKYPIKILDTLT